MLFVARFKKDDRDLTPILIDAPDAGIAADRIEDETGERPIVCVAVPANCVFAEIKFADVEDAGAADDEPGRPWDGNPANVTPMGVALEPFEEFADWLEAIDTIELPAVFNATEPAPAEDAAEVPDGG